MRVWGFTSQKGGVGKTSLSIHLATYAVACGERVVIVDLDPQENAKSWHVRRGDENTPPLVIPALPSNLGKVIDAAKTLGMTLVIVDTAGKADNVALSVIRASDMLIVPTLPNFFDIEALRGTVELINRVGKIDKAVAVVNGLNYNGAEQDFADAKMQAEATGIRVAPTYCIHRRPFARAIQEGKGVAEYAPKDKASAELIALWEHLNGLKLPRRSKEEAKKHDR